MSIRQGYFLQGNTIEITSTFTDEDGQPMAATDVSLIVKKPDDTNEVFSLVPVNGTVSKDLTPDQVGTWFIRIQCLGPTATAKESQFEVVESRVIS